MEDDTQLTDEEKQMLLEQGTEDYGYPRPESKESNYKFFRFMIEKKDSSKIANLSSTELGNPMHSVRGLQSIALYAEAEGLTKIAQHLRAEAEITLATSLSHKGFFPTIIITNQKITRSFAPTEKKSGWFSGGNKNKENDRGNLGAE